MIQLNDDQYWLYAAVDPETNELPYTSLEPTTNTGVAEVFLAEWYSVKYFEPSVLRNSISSYSITRFWIEFLNRFSGALFSEKHDAADAVFLIDDVHSLQAACHRAGYDLRYEKYGNRNAVERAFREIKRRTICFSNCFNNAPEDTADDWLRSLSFAWNQLI